jgi:hypothetical protein
MLQNWVLGYFVVALLLPRAVLHSPPPPILLCVGALQLHAYCCLLHVRGLATWFHRNRHALAAGKVIHQATCMRFV